MLRARIIESILVYQSSSLRIHLRSAIEALSAQLEERGITEFYHRTQISQQDFNIVVVRKMMRCL